MEGETIHMKSTSTGYRGRGNIGALRPVALLALVCAVVFLACSGSTGSTGDTGDTTPSTAAATATVTITPTATVPKPTSTPKPKPTATPIPIPFHVISASVSVKPDVYTGSCMNVTETFTYTFKLQANGPGGTLTYQTNNPDGPPSGVSSIKVKANQTTATATQQTTLSQTDIFADESPWIQVSSLKPNFVQSAKANYKFYCIS
jgi:hypothetical protein